MYPKKKSGQGLIEYLILVCLIAVSAIAVVSVVGVNIREQYARISQSLSNQKSHIPLSKPDPRSYQRRGLDDYTDSAQTGAGRGAE